MGEWRRRTAAILGCVTATVLLLAARQNPDPPGFELQPSHTLTGNAIERYLGDPTKDMTGRGVVLRSTGETGSVAEIASHFSGSARRSFRFSICGLPQDGFSVRDDALYLKVEFLGAGGTKNFDAKTKSIYPLIQQARHDLTVNGVRHTGGAAVWTTYSMDFVIPFAEVDELRLSVNFENGNGRATAREGGGADFYISTFDLVPLADAPNSSSTTAPSETVNRTHLISLGGRWSYAASADETTAPTIFDAHNATRLLYHDDRYSAPFAGMMSSTLRIGEKDSAGDIATRDQPIDDNVTVRFLAGEMIIHSRGLPNHPTGKFPESGFGRGFNPNFIIEQNETFFIPVNPQINPRHFTTDTSNSNHALPMGPIGIALNGIVFFNPFDMGNQDATDMMDRCCGHPNQDGQYHYHKYPICLNSPWSDRGEGHSPLIGFAFDGFPVYGPYESAGVMAKDISGTNALNAFNLHFDQSRGWHYHVTPGKFPYIIGGYWGTEDPQDNQRPRHPGGGMMPPPRPF